MMVSHPKLPRDCQKRLYSALANSFIPEDLSVIMIMFLSRDDLQDELATAVIKKALQDEHNNVLRYVVKSPRPYIVNTFAHLFLYIYRSRSSGGHYSSYKHSQWWITLASHAAQNPILDTGLLENLAIVASETEKMSGSPKLSLAVLMNPNTPRETVHRLAKNTSIEEVLAAATFHPNADIKYLWKNIISETMNPVNRYWGVVFRFLKENGLGETMRDDMKKLVR